MRKPKPMTSKQRSRQTYRNWDNGKYEKVNPCYGCGKSCGVDYCSHPLTDTGDWADIALVLCLKCAHATDEMTDPAEFEAYAKKHGGMQE